MVLPVKKYWVKYLDPRNNLRYFEDGIVGEEQCLSVIYYQLLKGIDPVDFKDTLYVISQKIYKSSPGSAKVAKPFH